MDHYGPWLTKVYYTLRCLWFPMAPSKVPSTAKRHPWAPHLHLFAWQETGDAPGVPHVSLATDDTQVVG